MGSTPARRLVHGFEVEEHDSVSSTQELLKQRLVAGEDVFSKVVRAGQQSLGKGRRGTPWTSLRGGSYQSLALKAADLLPRAAAPPGGPTTKVDGRLTLALGLGIAGSLNDGGSHVLLKWPNDLILDDKKLGGIIVELVAGTVIAGIGINVENEVPESAAALHGWDVEAVSDLVLRGVRDGLDLLRQSPENFALRYRALDWLRGREVEVRGADVRRAAGKAGKTALDSAVGAALGTALGTAVGTAVGTADGIEPDGSLRVRRQDGSLVRIVSGHVIVMTKQPDQP